MRKIDFYELPLVSRLTTCAAMFMIWVLFAEFVIDRYGFNEFIPFYRFGNICPYEFLVLLGIGYFWYRTHKQTD